MQLQSGAAGCVNGFVKIFSESSPCLIGQHGSCISAQPACGTLRKHVTEPFSQPAAQDCIKVSLLKRSNTTFYAGHTVGVVYCAAAQL